jgi:methylated-DNA-[protein]-cysteine S-methyltransferase
MIKQAKSLATLTTFEKTVLDQVKKIPKGKVTNYQILAKQSGKPKAVRATGNAVKKNPHLVKIPCHRVIKSDGGIGNYRMGLKKKISLLHKEGLKLDAKNKIKDLEKVIYRF